MDFKLNSIAPGLVDEEDLCQIAAVVTYCFGIDPLLKELLLFLR
jgi:hypothetical protein